jgi:hypothetical protein
MFRMRESVLKYLHTHTQKEVIIIMRSEYAKHIFVEDVCTKMKKLKCFKMIDLLFLLHSFMLV